MPQTLIYLPLLTFLRGGRPRCLFLYNKQDLASFLQPRCRCSLSLFRPMHSLFFSLDSHLTASHQHSFQWENSYSEVQPSAIRVSDPGLPSDVMKKDQILFLSFVRMVT